MKNILFDLLHMHTPSGREKELVEYVKAYFGSIGINVHVDNFGNCYVYIPGEGEPILLSAHMDVVSNGQIPDLYEENGFIKAKNNAIPGLDDKASVSIILALAKKLVQERKRHRPIEIALTAQEEPGCLGAAYMFRHASFSMQSKIGLCFDLPQPVGSILSGAAGIWRGSIEFLGKTGHSARPDEGKNALLAASLWAQNFLTNNRDSRRVNIGYIDAGAPKQFNVIPEHAVVELEIRGFEDIEKECQILRESFHGYNVEIKKKDEYTRIQQYEHAKSDVWIQKIENGMKDFDLRPKNVPRSFGASDANIFQAYGINVAVLGNGVQGTHGVEERVEFIELERLFNFLYYFFTI